MESQDADKALKALFDADKAVSPSEPEKQRKAALARARFNTANRDTLAFALIKLWTTLAQALAPIFAFFAVKNAHNVSTKPPRRPIDKR